MKCSMPIQLCPKRCHLASGLSSGKRKKGSPSAGIYQVPGMTGRSLKGYQERFAKAAVFCTIVYFLGFLEKSGLSFSSRLNLVLSALMIRE